MGYREFLASLLAPMGVYNLEEGYGAGELEAIGSALDGASLETDKLLTEVFFVTAEDSADLLRHFVRSTRKIPLLSVRQNFIF